MVNSRSRRVAIIGSLIVAALLVYQGVRGYQAFTAKAREQEAITESLDKWSRSYLALGESRIRWVKSYKKEDTVQDILSVVRLAQLESYGLLTNPDLVTVTKAEQVADGGAPIGLTRICIGTGSGDGGGLLVQAPSYDALLGGIEQLVKRPDVSLGNITLHGDKPIPVAKLGDFCLLLRND